MAKMIEYFTIDKAKVLNFARSGLAVLISVDGEEIWLPFSQIEEPDEAYVRDCRGLEIEMTIPAWLAKEKGLI